jgi:hypothetical protein
MEAEEVLVIFLSVALALFLTLAIILVAYCIKIATQISRMTDKAEHLIDTAGEMIDKVQNASAVASIGRILSHVFKATIGKNKHKED